MLKCPKKSVPCKFYRIMPDGKFCELRANSAKLETIDKPFHCPKKEG